MKTEEFEDDIPLYCLNLVHTNKNNTASGNPVTKSIAIASRYKVISIFKVKKDYY